MRKRQEALLYSQPHCPQATTEAVVKSASLGTFTYTVKGKRYLRGSCVSFGRHLHAPIGDMPQLAKRDTLLSPTYRYASSSKACMVAEIANAALLERRLTSNLSHFYLDGYVLERYI